MGLTEDCVTASLCWSASQQIKFQPSWLRDPNLQLNHDRLSNTLRCPCMSPAWACVTLYGDCITSPGACVAWSVVSVALALLCTLGPPTNNCFCPSPLVNHSDLSFIWALLHQKNLISRFTHYVYSPTDPQAFLYTFLVDESMTMI